jgi:protein-S-isoprenylcysteine O-methyltransferase Ste14
MFWRYLPLAGIVSLLVIAGCIRPLLQYLRYGTFGVFIFRSGGLAQKGRDALFVLLLAGLVAHGVTGPMPRPWVRPLVDGALYDALQVTGAILIVAGVLLFAAAQLNLGASWRIGIDETSTPGMVSRGLYALSRHPIFLGFLTVFTGYAAMLPTRLSLMLLRRLHRPSRPGRQGGGPHGPHLRRALPRLRPPRRPLPARRGAALISLSPFLRGEGHGEGQLRRPMPFPSEARPPSTVPRQKAGGCRPGKGIHNVIPAKAGTQSAVPSRRAPCSEVARFLSWSRARFACGRRQGDGAGNVHVCG